MSAILREGNTVTITPGQDLVSTMVPGFKQELARCSPSRPRSFGSISPGRP